jgi:hypothetical protein
LNAQRDGETFRFATYDRELEELDTDEAAQAYDRCVSIVRDQLQLLKTGHDVMEFSVMKFLRDNWSGVEHPDLVDEIFHRHFYPFVEHLWSGQVPAPVKDASLDLHRVARIHAKRRLNERAHRLRGELVALGMIPDHAIKGLAQLACEFALSNGLDHVLVGMRSERYVDDLRGLFAVSQHKESICP